MKKLNLLISAVNLDFGGIEKSLLNLLNFLNYDKFNVTLVLEEKKGIYLNDLKKEINIIEYSPSKDKNIFIRKFKNLYKRVLWYRKYYNKFDASVCYATYSYSSGFIARSSSKNRLIFIHSDYFKAFDNDSKKISNFFNKIKIKSYQKIICVSNEILNGLNIYFPGTKSKTFVINNFINYKEIIELSTEEIQAKSTNKICLFVGRIDNEVKRLDIILNLAEKSQNDKTKIDFWIVGDGPDLNSLKAKAKSKKLNNITFFGAKKNPYPYFKKCDCVILTSKYEGFPVIYNEALIFEKPILTTINVSDEYINIKNGYGIVSSVEDLYSNLNKVLDFKPEKIDFQKLNADRLKKLEQVIGDLNDKN